MEILPHHARNKLQGWLELPVEKNEFQKGGKFESY